MDIKDFDEKRAKEFNFFLNELKELGKRGLRPHQAYAALCKKADSEHQSKQDKFYWEGVYRKEFDYEEE